MVCLKLSTMSLDTAYKKFDVASEQALDWFQNELAGLRTGRVRTTSIEALQVEQYGVRTPLQGLASISMSDARTVVIAPWDPSALAGIEKAINDAQIGVQPVVDGKVIRLSFPSLNEEMREHTVKLLHKKAEETRVKLRQARDESLSEIKKEKEVSTITEDDFYEGKNNLDELINKANATIAASAKKKEDEIRTI